MKSTQYILTKVLALAVCVPLLLGTACTPQSAATPTAIPPTPVPSTATQTVPVATQTPAGFTVTDALGRTVTFTQVPQRIALAGKALFMIGDAIYLFPEAGKRITAIGSTKQGASDFISLIDADNASKTKLASDVGPEQIAAVKPDAVLLKSSLADTLGKPLESLGIPVVYIDFETPDQYQRDLKTLGQLFQNEARAKQVAAFYQERVDQITKALSGLKDDQKPRTLLLYYSEKNGAIAFNVPPMGWMQTQMVQMAGGRPVWQDANPGSGWTTVSLEQIAAWDADQIFIVAYSSPINDVIKKLKADTNWQELRAVKNGNIYGFATDMYSWDQPDTRWILGMTWLAGKLHPDLFPGLDMKKEAQTFYQELYGLDDAFFQKNILPTFTGDLP